MFNPQQQLQQQLLQLQHLIQQHQQQQQRQPPQQQPPPQQQQQQPAQQQQGGRALQQQQLLNLRPTNQTTILGANPMLQRAFLMQQMQGNLRGFNMTGGPALHPFFPQAARHSILGPPPVRVPLKPTRLGFPNLPFAQQSRIFYKDFQRSQYDRKRELEQASSSRAKTVAAKQGDKAAEEPTISETDSEKKSEENSKDSVNPEGETSSKAKSEDEPATKRLKLKSTEEELVETEDTTVLEESETGDTAASENLEMEDPASLEKLEMGELEAEGEPEEVDEAGMSETEEISEKKATSTENKDTEVLSAGGTLKVTIQQCSESRAISTTMPDPGHKGSEGPATGSGAPGSELVPKFYCYICNMNCYNQQNFKRHMSGIQHQQRLLGIQQMSNACLVTLLPNVKRGIQSPDQAKYSVREGGKSQQQRWCSTCQVHFSGDLIKHRRTQVHKAKLGEQGGPEDPEELITVDAVGCFEDDEDDEGISEEDEGSDPQQSLQIKGKDIALEAAEGGTSYESNTVYGPDFVVPVAGFLCRLCHKFYHSESAARVTHCKSLMHFENVQNYKAEKNYGASEPQSESRGISVDDSKLAQGEQEDSSSGAENDHAETRDEANGSVPAENGAASKIFTNDETCFVEELDEQVNHDASERSEDPDKDEEILGAVGMEGDGTLEDDHCATDNDRDDYPVENTMSLEPEGETDVESRSCSQEQDDAEDDKNGQVEMNEESGDLVEDGSKNQEVESDGSADENEEPSPKKRPVRGTPSRRTTRRRKK